MYRSQLLAAMLIILWTVKTTSIFASDWQKIDDSDGIQLFKKNILNSPLVAFKGTKIMQQPIAKVAQVLMDPNPKTRLEWIDMIMDFNFIEYHPDKAIAYTSYKLPWPLSNRDYIIQISLKIDKQTNKVYIYLKSVDHQEAPPTIGVRAELINSLYELEALPGGQTKVTVEIQTDPKGSIPSWIVNLVQKDWPANTLKAMEAQAAKPETISNNIVSKGISPVF